MAGATWTEKLKADRRQQLADKRDRRRRWRRSVERRRIFDARSPPSIVAGWWRRRRIRRGSPRRWRSSRRPTRLYVTGTGAKGGGGRSHVPAAVRGVSGEAGGGVPGQLEKMKAKQNSQMAATRPPPHKRYMSDEAIERNAAAHDRRRKSARRRRGASTRPRREDETRFPEQIKFCRSDWTANGRKRRGGISCRGW